MISQDNNFSNQSSADYSAVRSKVENQSRGFNIDDDEVTLSTNNENNATGNQNISSILSQIKDDGPAYNSSKKRDSVVNFKTNKTNSYAENQQYDEEGNGSARLNTSPGTAPQHNSVAGAPVVNVNNISWLQLFLLVTVIIVATFFLFRLDIRTNQLEESLSMYEANIQNSIASNRNELSPGIVSINEALQKVKDDLEVIKTGNLATVTVKQQPEQLSAAASLKQVETKAGYVNADTRHDQRSLLQTELASANKQHAVHNAPVIEKIENDINTTNEHSDKNHNNKITVNNKSAVSIKTSETKSVVVSKEIITSGWIVNLASFTSKDRTQGKVEQLLSLGYTPLIEEAVVNGKQVYRLIVDGFEERTQAELFVQLVAEQYGMTGGWIRKS